MKSARHLWNSGNFMFRTSVLLDEYRKFDAASVKAVARAVGKAERDLGFIALDPEALGRQMPYRSIVPSIVP